MKTRIATLAALLLGALAGAGGCLAPNRASLQVQALCYPTKDCSFSSTCDEYFSGVAGISGTGTLVLFAQVENQLPNNENLKDGRLNTNDANITEIHVEYEGGQTFTTNEGTNARVFAGGSTIVPLGLDIRGAGEILARVRLRGHYDNGSSFETGEFPISIVAGAGVCGASPCAGAADACPPSGGGAAQCPVNCSTTGTSTPGTFDVGGTISGLTGSGLILSTPGYADLSVTSGATTFAFPGVDDGATYNVTVRTQPAGQTCSVTSGGTGTVSGSNVTSVRITCA